MSNEIEIWKDVPNYENKYQISSFGNVKSIYRISGKIRLLRPMKDKDGYLYVALSVLGKIKTFKVHQLVAMAFHGHVPDGTMNIVVDHKDNNRMNNCVNNLQLIPHRENTSKDKKAGTSSFIGVYYSKKDNKWKVNIRFKDRKIHLGYFDFETDAANAYQKALKELEQGLDLNIIYPRRKNMSSSFVGVSWSKKHKKWRVRYKGKQIGMYNNEIEAYEARENYIKQLELIKK